MPRRKTQCAKPKINLTMRPFAKLKQQSTCSSKKIQHSDGLSARNHMMWLGISGHKGSSYVCPECGFIHITTQEPRPEKTHRIKT
jgi:hypothetical protein